MLSRLLAVSGNYAELESAEQRGCIIHEPICQLVPYRSRLSLRIERLFSPTHHLHHEVSVKSQTLPSIAKSLNKEGYTADMLYGGDINFTNMQSYFYSSGYSKITADRDFPLSSRLSKWEQTTISRSRIFTRISSKDQSTANLG